MWVNNLPNFSASARQKYCPEELLQQKNQQPKTNLTEEFKYKKALESYAITFSHQIRFISSPFYAYSFHTGQRCTP